MDTASMLAYSRNSRASGVGIKLLGSQVPIAFSSNIAPNNKVAYANELNALKGGSVVLPLNTLQEEQHQLGLSQSYARSDAAALNLSVLLEATAVKNT